MRRLAVFATTFVVTLAWAGPAGAQDDEIFFDDPDSPSGKEYALPLESGRAQGGGREGAEAAGDRLAGRFGEGVAETPPAAGSGGKGSGEDEPGGDDRRGGRDAGSGSGAGRDGGGSDGVPTRAATPLGAESGGTPELPLAGAIVAVLVLGGGLAFLLRRSRKA